MSFLDLLTPVIIPIAFAILFLVFVFSKFTTRSRCPAYHNKHPTRIARPWVFKSLLSFLPIRAYECQACGRSYYLLGNPSPPIDEVPQTFIKDTESN